jgi:CBS domain-containing protein/anti-sigma regulatory factor (Ser/Thr protein kinase)
MKEDEVSHVLQARKTQELVYELRVEQAMKENVCTVGPEETMDDVRDILREKKISGAPVVAGDELVGIISIEDLIKCLVRGEMKEKVKDKMTTDVATLYSDDLLVVAINRFEKYRYGRFPVVDRKSKRLIGILTKGDVIRCLLKKLEANHHEEERRRYRAGDLFEEINADESILVLRYSVEGSKFEKAGEKSSRLKDSLLRLGIPPDITRRVTIASYEAEMNMVIFTPGGELVASVEPKKVAVDAIDRGPGIPDIELAMQPGYSTAPDWVRELGFGAGMGLPNIKNCSDEMKLESKVGEGTKLHFMVLTGR